MAVVVKEKNAIVLKVRHPEMLTRAFKQHMVIDMDGQRLVALPHNVDTMRVLRNMGVNVAECSVLRHKYKTPLIKGKYAPMWHQLETASFLSEHARAFCLNQPRTGKTASVIMAADFLRRHRKGHRATLVVAPLSVLRDVWEDEVFGINPSIDLKVLHGSKEKRVKLLRQGADIFVINPAGIKVIEKELQKAVEDGEISLIVIDECTEYSNSGSEQWKAMYRVSRKCEYVWGLTGTPGGPEQVYGQAKLITPNNVNMSFTAWRNQTMLQVNKFKWVPRQGYLDDIMKILSPVICFKKADVIKVPIPMKMARSAPLSKDQERLFQKMKADMVSVADGITAANAGVLNLKLLQIATGAVKQDTGDPMILDIGPRIDELRKIIAETEYKVIVFSPFTAVSDNIHEQLSKYHSCAIVDGRVTGARRDKIFRDFREAKDPHVLIAHPRTTAYGLELAVADTIVFWGPPINGEYIYQQAAERISSAQQRSKTPAIIHLHSTFVERRLFKAIEEGVTINDSVLDIFHEIINNDT